MGHHIESTSSLFRSVRYNTKTSPELRAAFTRKLTEVRALTQGREDRILRLRDEYHIDAERLAQLIMQFNRDSNGFTSYNAQGSTPNAPLIPAGVIANIIHEHEMIDSEREQLRKIELILRNLSDSEFYNNPQTGEQHTRPCLHQLTDDELEYLGF
jgi:hypothetical protein